jgi:hypothetical protein
MPGCSLSAIAARLQVVAGGDHPLAGRDLAGEASFTECRLPVVRRGQNYMSFSCGQRGTQGLSVIADRLSNADSFVRLALYPSYACLIDSSFWSYPFATHILTTAQYGYK